MDLKKELQKHKTLHGRILMLFSVCGDNSSKTQNIANYMGGHRSTIDRYLSGEQSMRLVTIGLLIMAIKRYLKEDLNEPTLAKDVTIENLATGLTDDEYRNKLRVYDEYQLIEKLYEKLPKALPDPSEFENGPYAFDLIDKWETTQVGEKYLKDVYIHLTFKEDKKKADNVLNTWAKNPDSQAFFLLLGDIGIGKTSTLLHFAAKQAQRHVDNPQTEPLPIYINLGKYRQIGDIEILLKQLLFDHFGQKIQNMEHLLNLVQHGRIIFILDGFDEMAKRLTWEKLFEHLLQIERLYHKNGKMILSSRKQLFSSQEQITDLFNRTKLGPALSAQNGISKELNQFTQKNIEEYIERYFGELHYKKYYSKLEKLSGFSELKFHPMMLEIMVQIIPQLKDVSTFTKAGMFSIYYNQWCDRKKRKEERRIIEAENLKIFCQELAGKLWILEQPYISYNKLKEEIKLYFNPEDPNEFENIRMAVNNNSFLTRNRDEWSFMHEAFFHYFLALAIVNSKNSDKILGTRKLPLSILDFLKDLPIDPGELVIRSNEMKKKQEQSKSEKIVYENILLILRAKDYETHLFELLNPKVMEQINSIKGLLNIINKILPSISVDKTSTLADIMEKFVSINTKHAEFHGLAAGRSLDYLIKFAEFQNKTGPAETNPKCSLDIFCDESIFESDPEFDIEKRDSLNKCFRDCSDLIKPEDYSSSQAPIQFTHDFLFHYFLAFSWFERITRQEPESMGYAPVHKETVEWFLRIAPEHELFKEKYKGEDADSLDQSKGIFDPSKVSIEPGPTAKILIKWLEASKNEVWRQNVGNYMGSICLSILCRIKELKLAKLPLSRGHYPDSFLKDSDLSDLDLSNSNFNRTCFENCDLRNTILSNGTFISADFSGASMTKALLQGADLSHTRFKGAFLTKTDLSGCNLTEADFSGTGSIEDINLEQAIMQNTRGLE
jgi:hypothetical protein